MLEGHIRTEDELIGIVDGMTLEQVAQAAERVLDFQQLALSAAGRVKSKEIYQSLIDGR